MHYDSTTARFVAPGKDRNKLVESVPRHSEIFLPNERGIRPPLKWAGGKRWLVSHVKPMYDSHKRLRLVEPFCGGLAVTLGLLPDRAMVNDINPHAINFYTWLKRGMIVGLEMSNDEITYYRHRESFNRLIEEGRANSRAAAELFYYLNRTGLTDCADSTRRDSSTFHSASIKTSTIDATSGITSTSSRIGISRLVISNFST